MARLPRASSFRQRRQSSSPRRLPRRPNTLVQAHHSADLTLDEVRQEHETCSWLNQVLRSRRKTSAFFGYVQSCLVHIAG